MSLDCLANSPPLPHDNGQSARSHCPAPPDTASAEDHFAPTNPPRASKHRLAPAPFCALDPRSSPGPWQYPPDQTTPSTVDRFPTRPDRPSSSTKATRFQKKSRPQSPAPHTRTTASPAAPSSAPPHLSPDAPTNSPTTHSCTATQTNSCYSNPPASSAPHTSSTHDPEAPSPHNAIDLPENPS